MTALPPLARHRWDKVYYAVVMERDVRNSLNSKSFNLNVIGTGLSIHEAKDAALNNLTNNMNLAPSTYKPYVLSVMDCGLDSGVRREAGSPAMMVVRYCDAKLYLYSHDREYGYKGLVCFYDPVYSGHLARYLTYKFGSNENHEDEGHDAEYRKQRRAETGRAHIRLPASRAGSKGAFKPLNAKFSESKR